MYLLKVIRDIWKRTERELLEIEKIIIQIRSATKLNSRLDITEKSKSISKPEGGLSLKKLSKYSIEKQRWKIIQGN